MVIEPDDPLAVAAASVSLKASGLISYKLHLSLLLNYFHLILIRISRGSADCDAVRQSGRTAERYAAHGDDRLMMRPRRAAHSAPAARCRPSPGAASSGRPRSSEGAAAAAYLGADRAASASSYSAASRSYSVQADRAKALARSSGGGGRLSSATVRERLAEAPGATGLLGEVGAILDPADVLLGSEIAQRFRPCFEAMLPSSICPAELREAVWRLTHWVLARSDAGRLEDGALVELMAARTAAR